MAAILLEPNRAYPSIPTVGETLESHRLALEAIVECIQTHERRSKNVLDSFVRVGELQELGLIELEATGSTGSLNPYVIDDDPSEETTAHHHNGTYLRIDGDNDMDNSAAISWKNSAGVAVDYLVHQGAATPVTVEHVYSVIDTSPTPAEVTDDTSFQVVHTVLGAGALTVGDTYLLVAEAMYGAASSANHAEATDSDVRWRYNGATLASDATTDRDIDVAGDQGEQIGFAKIVTGANSALTFEGKTDASPNNSIQSSHARAMAINLTDLTASNYIAETTVANGVGVAGTEDVYASVGTYNIGDGTSDYILFCNFKAVMTDASAGNVPDFEAWLRVNGGPFTNSEIIRCGGTERTHDGESFSRVFALAVPAAAAATLDFQCAWHSGAGFVITTDGTVTVTLSIIALRLNDFDDYFITSSADLTDPPAAGEYERLNTSRSSTAANGNWSFFGGLSSYYPGSSFSSEAEVRLSLNAGGDVAVAGDINTTANNTSSNQAAWIPTFPLAATNVNNSDSMEIGLFLNPAPNVASETWQAGFIAGWSHSAQPTVEKFIVGDPGYPIEIDGTSAKVNTTLNVTGATDLDSTLNVDGIADFQTDARVFGNLGVGPGITLPAHVLHLRDDTTDTAANEIANFEWLRPNPANNDNLDVLFSLANSVGTGVEVGRIKYQIQDITAGAEDGALIFDVIRAGVLEQVAVMDTDEIIFNDAGADRNFIVKQSGGGTAMQVTGSTGDADFNNNVDINGGTLTIYDGTGADSLAVSHDGTDAILNAVTGNLGVLVGGANRMQFTTSGFESGNSGGARITDSSGSAANPTVEPNKIDPNTGIYGSGDTLYLIAGQVNGLTLKEVSNEVRAFWDIETSLTASVTQTQAGAKITDASVANYTIVANPGDAGLLQSANTISSKSAFQAVINSGANSMQLFPATGNKFNGQATNDPINIGPGEMRVFYGGADATYYEAAVPVFGLTLTDVLLDNTTGTPDYTTALDYLNTAGQVGSSSGGVITDNGDGTVAITEWHGWLRTGGAITALHSTKIAADASLAVTDGVVSYIYAEYNAGTPQFAAYTAWQTDLNGKVWIGSVHRNGLSIHVTSSPVTVPDFINTWANRSATVYGIVRETGGITSETGTRNIAITAGQWWLGTNEFSTTAKDTSVADNFSYYYRDGVGGYTEVATQTQIDNTQYDDGSGTLATLGTNRYGVHWVYTAMDDDVYVVYGRGDYTLVQAEAATAPSDVPDHVVPVHGLLIAKIIVRKSAATFTSVQNPFTQTFTMSGAIDHGELAGLTDDDHTQYLLADGSRAADPILKIADGAVWATDGLHLDLTNQAGFLGDDFGIKIYAGGGRYIGYWDDTGLAGKHVADTVYLVMDASASATTPIYTFSGDSFSGIGRNADNMVSLIGLSKEIARVDGTLAAENFSIRGGYEFRIYDSTNVDNVAFSHDGTDLYTDFTTTAWWRITNITSGVIFDDGCAVYIRDTTGVDSVAMSHDGTDFNMTFTGTSAINITGATDLDLPNAFAINSATGGWWTIDEAGDPRIIVDHIDSRFTIGDGYRLRLRDATNTNFADIYQSTTDTIINSDGGTAVLKILNFDAVQVQDGAKLRIYNTGDTDYLEADHDGTDFNFDFVNTADVHFTGATTQYDFDNTVRIIDGGALQVFDSTNTDQVQIAHTGVTGLFTITNSDGVQFNVDSTPSFKVYDAVSLGDDATGTWNTPRGRAHGIWFVMNTWDDSGVCQFAHTAQSITVMATGANGNVGDSGVNPDVDTDVNCWMSSSTQLSVKNRTGGTVSFTVVYFGS